MPPGHVAIVYVVSETGSQSILTVSVDSADSFESLRVRARAMGYRFLGVRLVQKGSFTLFMDAIELLRLQDSPELSKVSRQEELIAALLTVSESVSSPPDEIPEGREIWSLYLQDGRQHVQPVQTTSSSDSSSAVLVPDNIIGTFHAQVGAARTIELFLADIYRRQDELSDGVHAFVHDVLGAIIGSAVEENRERGEEGPVRFGLFGGRRRRGDQN